jgi:glyceraldehyde-3-phosphate dehydrogenase/erythrose-4-phosphate dehydrogenase
VSSKIAIDGFRRTGRSLFRAALYYPDLEVVALNALSEAPTRGDTGEFESHE